MQISTSQTPCSISPTKAAVVTDTHDSFVDTHDSFVDTHDAFVDTHDASGAAVFPAADTLFHFLVGIVMLQYPDILPC